MAPAATEIEVIRKTARRRATIAASRRSHQSLQNQAP